MPSFLGQLGASQHPNIGASHLREPFWTVTMLKISRMHAKVEDECDFPRCDLDIKHAISKTTKE